MRSFLYLPILESHQLNEPNFNFSIQFRIRIIKFSLPLETKLGFPLNQIVILRTILILNRHIFRHYLYLEFDFGALTVQRNSVKEHWP